MQLTADDLRAIEEAVSKITIHGDRYPAHLAQRVGRRKRPTELIPRQIAFHQAN